MKRESAPPIETELTDGVLVLRFRNPDLRLANCTDDTYELGERLKAVVDEHAECPVVLDFQNEDFIPSLGAFCNAIVLPLHRKLRKELRLCNVPPLVVESLQMVGLTTVLQIHGSRNEALGLAARG